MVDLPPDDVLETQPGLRGPGRGAAALDGRQRMPKTAPVSVVCEQPVGSGQCGVTALGRCARCARAFCSSHRAYSISGAAVIDECTACRSELKAAGAERTRLALMPYTEAEQRAKAALASLQADGAPGQAVRRRRNGSRQTLLGRRPEYVEDEPAWPVGRLTVEVGEGGDDKLAECGVLRDGRVVTMDPLEEGRSKMPDLNNSWPYKGFLSQMQQIADRLEEVIRKQG